MDSYKNVPQKEEGEEKIDFKGYGKRHTQAILIFCCMVTTSCVKGCFNVAILAMTDPALHGNETATLDWDKPTQGIVMSAFHWGDLVMQIPAGYLVCKYGGKPFITFTLLTSALCAFTTPACAIYAGWQGACVNRVVLGLVSSFTFPCIHTWLGKWAPVSERNRFGIMIYSGLNIAIISGNPVSAFIATSGLGWPYIFHFFGMCCAINAVFWIWIGANTPAEHSSITTRERRFIESSLGEAKEELTQKVPWKSIFTSKCVIALIFTQTFLYSCYSVLFFEIPTFFKMGLNIDLESSGILSSLPYVASYISSIVCGLSADFLLNRSVLSLTVIRKVFNTLGSLIPATGLIVLSYMSRDNKALAITLVVIIIAGDTLSCAGFMLNHIDLSPNFAAIIVSWSLTISDIGNLLAPIASGNIVKDPTDMARWRTLFMVVAAGYFVGNLVFVIFGTGEVQPWNNINDTPKVVLEPSDLTQELRLTKHTEENTKSNSCEG